METSSFIAIYMPIIILFIIIIPSNNRAKMMTILKRKRGRSIMNNELLKNYIGKVVTISMGSLGQSYSKATIVEIVDNWMKIEVKGKTDLVNTEYIQSIRVN